MNNEIPEEIRKMFPDQPIHKMDIDDNGNLQIFASTEPLSNEPDFDNLPKEQIDQYLREHGYDPEQVRITGKIFITALIENVTLQARIAALEAQLKIEKELSDKLCLLLVDNPNTKQLADKALIEFYGAFKDELPRHRKARNERP